MLTRVEWVDQVGWVQQVAEWLEQPSNNVLNPFDLLKPINPLLQ